MIALHETATVGGMGVLSRSLMLTLTRLSFGGEAEIEVGTGTGGLTVFEPPVAPTDSLPALIPNPTPKLSGLARLCALGGMGGLAAAATGQIDTLRAGIDVERASEALNSDATDGLGLKDGACADADEDVDVEDVGSSRGTGFRSVFFEACGDDVAAGSCLAGSSPGRRGETVDETATSLSARLVVIAVAAIVSGSDSKSTSTRTCTMGLQVVPSVAVMDGGVVGGGSLQSDDENEGRGEFEFELGQDDVSVSELHESAFGEFSNSDDVAAWFMFKFGSQGGVRVSSMMAASVFTIMSGNIADEGGGDTGEGMIVGNGVTLAVAVEVDAYDAPVASDSALAGIAGTGTSWGYNAGTGLRRTRLARFCALGVGLTGETDREASGVDRMKLSGENETSSGVEVVGGGR